MNDLLELIKERRSIRKYQEKQIPLADLETIVEAGLYAPNAGGGQRSKIVAIQNRILTEELGRRNIAHFNRANLAGSYVSSDQPSVIDDPTIKSGFYGAPTVCAIFSPKNFLYSIPDAFCCAENMVLEASALGIASCIVARGEETFDNEFGEMLMQKWEIPSTMIARCFVLLGYCEGEYPAIKPRKPGRSLIVE
ncbi:MAG TPA: nitroreductase family protein [Spirochaetales bacterium]|nr:nitroreductase family protein [Spirochaetales bacterium]